MQPSLETLTEEWLRLDKNEATREEIKNLLANGDESELEKRMLKRIEFGTAGLRGKMEAGWSRMNDLIVIQASQGLSAYVLQTIPDATEKGVVIGHDHRHHSSRWSELVAMVFLNDGFKVYLHSELVHTPLVPFSISTLRAACGVMITASHNPKQDNGYKVYWENAVQIISPHDVGITNAIKENCQPMTWDTKIVKTSPLCHNVTHEMCEAYFGSLATLSLSRSINPGTTVKFVNTSLHGVGHPFVVKAFEVFGLPPFFPVSTQQAPDPEFRTVRFPNPEEKGALDMAIHEADAVGASYILAQDPDADRFSAAEKRLDGSWSIYTGDQLGALFAARCLESHKASGKPLNKLAMVASTVSSKMIETMAFKEGFKFLECLTGFKYIGNTVLQLVEEGYEVPFAYEEAIGFMIGATVRDKDGISATACFAELAVTLAARGLRVSEFLDELYNRYGHFKTSNSYFVCNDPQTIDRIFARLRSFKGESEGTHDYPSSIAGLQMTSVRDLTVGYDSANPPTYKPTLPLSSGHMIQFRAQSVTDDTGISLTIRTSGTEPKIKYYLEGSGSNSSFVDETLVAVVTELRTVWMEAEKNSLTVA